MKVREDPYARLSDENSSVRIDAAIALIQDIHRCHTRDEEAAKQSKEAVKRTADGLTIHLDYVLNRLISGLESTDRFATIGFSTALSMVLQHFDEVAIPNLALEGIIMKGQTQTYSALTHTEKQAFDLGCLYLLQILHRVNRLDAVSATSVESLLAGLSRLFKNYPSMGEICVETVSSLSESLYKSTSQHYHKILSVLTGFIPNTPHSIKPPTSKINPSVPAALQQWNAATVTAALTLRRIGQSAVHTEQFPGFFDNIETWPTIYTIIAPSLIEYPSVHAAWTHLLLDSIQTPGQFKQFWDRIIAPQLSQAYSYHRKGTAMGIIVNILTKIMSRTQTALHANQPAPFSPTTLQMIISTTFSTPLLVNAIMMQARALDTPLYLQSVTVLNTLEQLCVHFPSLTTFIIATFQNPSKGGHRSFDTKSNTKFIHNLSQLLTASDLVAYISTTIDSFHNAAQVITADIKHIATVEKQRQDSNIAMIDQQEAESSGQNSKKDPKAKGKKKDDKVEKTEESSVLSTDFSIVKDVDTFMASEMAQGAIARGVAAFQSWTVDHVYHLCELLFKLQRSAQFASAQQQPDESEREQVKGTKKGKKGDAKKAAEKPKQAAVGAEELEETLQKCIEFLYSHAFFKSNPSEQPTETKKGKKVAATAPTAAQSSYTLQHISPTCQELFQQRFISLYSTLHEHDSHYHPHSAISLYFGQNETRWGSYVHQLDVKLRTVANLTPIISDSDENKNAIENTTQTLAAIDSFIELLQPAYEKDRKSGATESEAKDYIDLATMMKYLVTTCYALFYSDASILSGTLSDLKIILFHIQQDYFAKLKKAGKPIELSKVEKAMIEKDDVWVDILLDLLLSILGLGHALTRHVVLRSFKLLIPRLQMSSVQLLVDPIAQAIIDEEEPQDEEEEEKKPSRNKKGDKGDAKEMNKGGKDAKMQDDDKPDDFLDFDEDDDTDIDDEDFGSLIQQFNAMSDGDDDNGDDEDAESDTEELGALGATDILLDNHNIYMTRDQEDAIAGIVRIHKEKRNAQKNKLHAQMIMKLRILDLLEVLMDELHGTNAWLSLLLPLIVLIKSSRSSEVVTLHQRAITLFKNKLTHSGLQGRFGAKQRAELKLTESDPLFKYITIDQDASSDDLITPQQICHGDSLQSILEAIFESMASQTQPEQSQPQQQQQQHESGMNRSTMAGHALAAVAYFYLIAPAGSEEMAAINPKPKKSTARGKKAASSLSASTMSTDQMQKTILANRVQYFVQSLIPLIKLQYGSKKEHFTPSFFETIFHVPTVSGAYLWTPCVTMESGPNSIITILQSAMSTVTVPFLRNQAADLLVTILKNFKHAIINNGDKLESIYDQLATVFKSTTAQIQSTAAQIEDLQKQPQRKDEGKKGDAAAQKRKSHLKQLSSFKTSCQSICERSRAVIQLLEDKLQINTSILPPTKKDKGKKAKAPVTPAKADKAAKAATPAKVEEAPAKVAKTPVKPKVEQQVPIVEQIPGDDVTIVEEPVKKTRKSVSKKAQATMVDEDITPVVEEQEESVPATPTRRGRKPAALTVSIQECEDIPQPRRSPRRAAASAAAGMDDGNGDDEIAEIPVAPRRGRRAAAAKVEEPQQPEVQEETKPVRPSKRRATTQQPADDDNDNHVEVEEEQPVLRRSSRRR